MLHIQSPHTFVEISYHSPSFRSVRRLDRSLDVKGVKSISFFPFQNYVKSFGGMGSQCQKIKIK